MTDVSAAVAGGVTGGAAGKKVSEGVTGVFGKIVKQTEKAAGEVKPKAPPAAAAQGPQAVAAVGAAPLIEAGPGLPKSGGVPLPPPAPRKVSVEKPAPVIVAEPVVVPEPVPPPPPPPEVTPEDLKKVAEGMPREDLLKLGAPASRITMFDDGHLQETYRYAAKDVSFGVVRLVDGAVATVEVR